MSAIVDQERISALRRADFRTAIILIAVSASMIWTALGYPLRESYGGVENSWFLSPALFPLLIGGGLMLLSIILLGNAIRHIGAERQWHLVLHPSLTMPGQRGLRTLLITSFIGGYTWLLLPDVDFVISTVLFLLAFIGTFYVCEGNGAWVLAAGYLGICATLKISALIASSGIWPLTVTDWVGLLAIALLFGLLVYQGHSQQQRTWLALATAVGSALLITICFRFGLLVPLPFEGLVIDGLQDLRGLLR